MNLLLDTHILLWWLDNSSHLTQKTKSLISDIDNIIFVSSASIWEISIKAALNKLQIPNNLAESISACSFEELTITHIHANKAGSLPTIHNDPFDRMLIAQAQFEKLHLVTHDSIFKKYDVKVFLSA